jgi:hypothetical protein
MNEEALLKAISRTLDALERVVWLLDDDANTDQMTERAKAWVDLAAAREALRKAMAR